MLYSEFVEGTGCKLNDHNYKVYKDLEVMYMNSNLTKTEIYEYGKKLVDNSKSEEEIKFEENIKAQITELKEEHKHYVAEAKRYEEYYKENKTDKFWKDQMDWSKRCASIAWNKIKNLKWVLE